MSYLVLHMDKFKMDGIRGIQSHNRRERKSLSNPDIDGCRSCRNYELAENPQTNYTKAIQKRIEELHLPKAVRKDAVVLCGLVVSSDSEFFAKLSPERQRVFFEVCRQYLESYVGKENVVSAMVHMDEKTPHMHFLHVPVKDGRLCANKIYTPKRLSFLQEFMPAFIKDFGFEVERGVKQKPGSSKVHLDTPEYKQQMEALKKAEENVKQAEKHYSEIALAKWELGLQLESFERLAKNAEERLQKETELPEATLFNYKSVLEKAASVIAEQKKALACQTLHQEKYEEMSKALKRTQQELRRTEQRLTDMAKAWEEERLMVREAAKYRAANEEPLKKFMARPKIKAAYEVHLAEQAELARQEHLRKVEEELRRLDLERRLEEEKRLMRQQERKQESGLRMC